VEYGAEAYIHTQKRSKTIRALSIINGDYPFYTSNSSIKDYISIPPSLRATSPMAAPHPAMPLDTAREEFNDVRNAF